MTAKDEDDHADRACAYFTPDAYRVENPETKSVTPILQWCAKYGPPLPDDWDIKRRPPSVQEELPIGNETWVRLQNRSDPPKQRVVALIAHNGGWLISRWCNHDTGGGDPFHCLRATP